MEKKPSTTETDVAFQRKYKPNENAPVNENHMSLLGKVGNAFNSLYRSQSLHTSTSQQSLSSSRPTITTTTSSNEEVGSNEGITEEEIGEVEEGMTESQLLTPTKTPTLAPLDPVNQGKPVPLVPLAPPQVKATLQTPPRYLPTTIPPLLIGNSTLHARILTEDRGLGKMSKGSVGTPTGTDTEEDIVEAEGEVEEAVINFEISRGNLERALNIFRDAQSKMQLLGMSVPDEPLLFIAPPSEAAATPIAPPSERAATFNAPPPERAAMFNAPPSERAATFNALPSARAAIFNATPSDKTMVFDTPIPRSSHSSVLADNSVRSIPVGKHVLRQIVEKMPMLRAELRNLDEWIERWVALARLGNWSEQETLGLVLTKLPEETQNAIFNRMMSMGPGEWTLDHLWVFLKERFETKGKISPLMELMHLQQLAGESAVQLRIRLENIAC